MTLTDWLDELSSLLAECDRMDDTLDGIEATYGAHVLIAQTRDQVLVVRRGRTGAGAVRRRRRDCPLMKPYQ